jgi:hypothetical protein
MTRTASRAAVAAAPASTPTMSTPSGPTRRQAIVRLGDLDIAPENLRHGEPHLKAERVRFVRASSRNPTAPDARAD